MMLKKIEFDCKKSLMIIIMHDNIRGTMVKKGEKSFCCCCISAAKAGQCPHPLSSNNDNGDHCNLIMVANTLYEGFIAHLTSEPTPGSW